MGQFSNPVAAYSRTNKVKVPPRGYRNFLLLLKLKPLQSNIRLRSQPNIRPAEDSAEDSAEYSASRRFSRIFGWCADLAPSRLLQLIQAQLSVESPACRKANHRGRAEWLIRLMKIWRGGVGLCLNKKESNLF